MVSSHVEIHSLRESKRIAANSTGLPSAASCSPADLQRKMVVSGQADHGDCPQGHNVKQLQLQLQQRQRSKTALALSQQHDIQRRKLQAPSPLKQQMSMDQPQKQRQQHLLIKPKAQEQDNSNEPANQDDDATLNLDALSSPAAVPMRHKLAHLRAHQKHQQTQPVSHQQSRHPHRHHTQLQPARVPTSHKHQHHQQHQATRRPLAHAPAPAPAQVPAPAPGPVGHNSQSLRPQSSSVSHSSSSCNSYVQPFSQHQWSPSQCQSPSTMPSPHGTSQSCVRPNSQHWLEPSSHHQHHHQHQYQQHQPQRQQHPSLNYPPPPPQPSLSTTSVCSRTCRASSYNQSVSCPDVDPRSFRLRPLDSSGFLEEQFCGWLWMRKSRLSRWKNRYFCLNGSMLSFFTSFPSEDFLRQAQGSNCGLTPAPMSPGGTTPFAHAETSQPCGVLRIAHVDESRSRLGFKVWGTCGTCLDIRAPRLDLRNDWLRALKAPARRKTRAWSVGCPEEFSISLSCLEQDALPTPERLSIPIVKCGWLEKQASGGGASGTSGGSVLDRMLPWTRWKKYFFVIQGKMLSFYASDKPYDVPKRRGYIVGVSSIKSEKKLRIKLEDPTPFALVVRAKDLDQLEEWRESLLMCLDPTMSVTL